MTGNSIESYLYERVCECALPISGSVYKRGMRPLQDNTLRAEDAVVAVITGSGNQIQEGTCVVNIYVPDVIVADGRYLENKERTEQIAEILDQLPERLRQNSDIYFERQEMILTLEENATHEHFVSLKMKFKLLTH